MLRPYFLFHRELLGELARLAYETVREMMAKASDEPSGCPGMVAVIQTFGSSLKWNPHIHALVTRGVFLDGGFITEPKTIMQILQHRDRPPSPSRAPPMSTL